MCQDLPQGMHFEIVCVSFVCGYKPHIIDADKQRGLLERHPYTFFLSLKVFDRMAHSTDNEYTVMYWFSKCLINACTGMVTA